MPPAKQVIMNYLTSAFFLVLSTFLAGVPESGARGGKGAKGAGGGATRYGHRGVYNAAAYEMTWEDIVLAMQLSAMCFGALLALCIVACCAYKICGPAEEEDWGRRYRTTFKPVSKVDPELLKEIYTVPSSTLSSTAQSVTDKKETSLLPPNTPTTSNTTLHKHSLSEGGAILGTAVSVDTPHHSHQQQYHLVQQYQLQQQMQRPLPPPPNLPNGRVMVDDSSRGGCLSLGGVLDHHRPRGGTMSSLSTSRLLTEARRPGVAPRLAAHLNNSTLDLTHPPPIFMPTLNASTRSLSEPQTAIV